jgi:hypothetical protein
MIPAAGIAPKNYSRARHHDRHRRRNHRRDAARRIEEISTADPQIILRPALLVRDAGSIARNEDGDVDGTA